MATKEVPNDVTRVRERYIAAQNSRNSCADRMNNMSKFLYAPGTSGYVTPSDSVTPDATINMYIVAVEQLIALLNDTPMSITTVPKKPDVDFDALVYQQVINWVLSRNRIDMMRPIVEKNSAIYGTGVIKLIPDPVLGIKMKNIDPRRIVIDPIAYGDIDEAMYVIEAIPYTREELQRLYPKKTIISSSDSGITHAADLDIITQYNAGELAHGHKEVITVYEHWSPSGRLVTTDFQVLEEESKNDWPFYYPYVLLPWYVLPDRLFGRDIITDTEKVLNTLNRMYQNLDVILAKTANPQRIVSTNAGINTDKLTNEPGLTIRTTLSDVRGAINWAPTAQVQREYFDYIQRLEYYLTMLFGTQDILMGRATINSNIPSGRSLEELSNAAQTRLREVFRNVKSMYTSLGRKIIALIPLVFGDEDIVRITGSDIEMVEQALKREAIRVGIEVSKAGAQTPEEIQKGVTLYQQEKGRNLDGDGSVAYMKFVGSKLADPAEFDIDVNGGLDIPKTKMDMVGQIKELFMAGKVDLETYLDIAEVPQKDKIIKRNAEMQEFIQWKAMQAQAAKQGVPGMPPMPPGMPPESQEQVGINPAEQGV